MSEDNVFVVDFSTEEPERKRKEGKKETNFDLLLSYTSNDENEKVELRILDLCSSHLNFIIINNIS